MENRFLVNGRSEKKKRLATLALSSSLYFFQFRITSLCVIVIYVGVCILKLQIRCYFAISEETSTIMMGGIRKEWLHQVGCGRTTLNYHISYV